MFAVKTLFSFPVGNAEQFPGITVTLPCFVYLQLHPEKARSRTKELGRRLVIVILNGIVPLHSGVTIPAHGVLLFLVIRGIADILHANERAAAVTAGVVVVIASLTQRRFRRPGIVIGPDPLSAHGADDGLLPETLRAKISAVEFVQLIHGPFLQTAAAGKGFVSFVLFHGSFLLNMFVSLVDPGYIHEDNI